jgi:hypothetical protein
MKIEEFEKYEKQIYMDIPRLVASATPTSSQKKEVGVYQFHQLNSEASTEFINSA